MIAAIDRSVYTVVAIGITRDGAMYVHNSLNLCLPLDATGLPFVAPTDQRVVLSTDPAIRGFLSVNGSELPVELSSVDVAFPVLHGPFGEDGTIQGVLEFVGIPCVGSGVFSSAAAMDKAHMKAMFTAHGIPSCNYTVITDEQWRLNPDAALNACESLGFPQFVKPARAGSSIGITKVKDASALRDAIEVARLHDPKVIVEATVSNMREIECAVIASADGTLQTSLPSEIEVTGNHEFYDFDAKYLEDSAILHVPANLSDSVSSKVRATALEAFRALDCEGYARCDFFVTEAGDVIVNEVNTLPGFTQISMFPRMLMATGMTYPEIVSALIADAVRRGTGLR